MLTEFTQGRKMSELLKRLNGLIAKKYGVNPNDITPTFIEEKRKEIYAKPEHIFEFDSKNGGYNSHGLEVLNRSQLAEERKKADSFLMRIVTGN